MKITFSKDDSGAREKHQARAEQSFSTGDGHGDFCLTAYGRTQDEAHFNLKQLALTMVREMDAIKFS
ncbi:hypothetical protein EON80_16500 [bacterium]|nr:MAG: hypothetical protein EON80_16500 [bacterium]